MFLFDPIHLGTLKLRNRVIMSSMTRRRASDDGIVQGVTVTYYEQRAGAGLIISEATNITEDAVGTPNTPGIYTPEQIAAWKRVTDAVHSNGGKIFCQLWHTGRVGHSLNRGGERPVGPSPVPIEGQQIETPDGRQDFEVPRTLTTEEVEQIVEDYVQAGQNAREAGFDGIELHAANGYLPAQFLVDGVNKRTDKFGGSLENRARFIMTVMERLMAEWGPDRVGIKLSPSNYHNGMYDSNPLETYGYLLQRLNMMALAYIQLVRPMYPVDHLENWPSDMIEAFGGLIDRPLMLGGGMDHDTSEELIRTKQIDMASFGRLYIANPDLPMRFMRNLALNEFDPSTFYVGGEKGYIDYAAAVE